MVYQTGPSIFTKRTLLLETHQFFPLENLRFTRSWSAISDRHEIRFYQLLIASSHWGREEHMAGHLWYMIFFQPQKGRTVIRYQLRGTKNRISMICMSKKNLKWLRDCDRKRSSRGWWIFFWRLGREPGWIRLPGKPRGDSLDLKNHAIHHLQLIYCVYI